MTKSPTQLDAEIAVALADGPHPVDAPGHPKYGRITYGRDTAAKRWIGRCKRCRATHKLEGVVATGQRRGDPTRSDFHQEQVRSRSDGVIVDADGRVFMTGDQGSNPYKVVVKCGDHWCALSRVHEGTKKSKHECGARCTSATGPNCDCRCRGQNHGRDC